MNIINIFFKDIPLLNERHNLYVFYCNSETLPDCVSYFESEKINVLNFGKEVAKFIESLPDYRYLNIDVYDYCKKLLDLNKSKINDKGNEVIAIYNLGILLEPSLELNPVQLFKEFSKSAAMIIIWENESQIPDRLNWPTQKDYIYLDLSDIYLKKLQYAI